jgi:SAM-dependent methyltransferase
MTMTKPAGTDETRRFYDERGWHREDGQLVDQKLFGTKEDGPIRIELFKIHQQRVQASLAKAGPPLKLLECGCGGTPEKSLLGLCSSYVGADFSDVGLTAARASFADVAIPHDFQVADVCNLPFKDGQFDALYSAHMIYHIEDPAAQAAALNEFMRVLRPGGVAVIVAANPRPLLFPIRLVRRLLSDTPLIGKVIDRVRTKPPIPYQPMPIGWMRRELGRHGTASVETYAIPSTAFNQKVTEYAGMGRVLWKAIRWLDIGFPRLSAYLGNYIVLTCRKSGGT